MRRGFTLLELIVVMIIIGILATLGFSQYATMIEKSRGAEAKGVIGTIRLNAAGIQLEQNGDLTAIGTPANLGIGSTVGLIASTCSSATSPNYYFSYSIANTTNPVIITANRCTAGTSKAPRAASGYVGTLVLTTNLATGLETWSSTGGY